MNLPNKITISRICLIPVFAAVFYMTFIPYNYSIAALIFIIAAATDVLDGYIARKNNIVTNLGKFLDPIADKVLVSTALILLLTADIVPPVLGGIAVSVILARELMVSGFRMVAAGTGLILAADNYGKIKTLFQDLSVFVLLISADLLSGDISNALNLSGIILLIIAAALTLYSGARYLIKNKAVFEGSK